MKKNISLIKTLLFILIVLSCNSKKEKQQYKREKQQDTTEKQQSESDIPPHIKLLNNKTERTRLWEAAINDGNFVAYNKISVAYILGYRFVDLYYYSLIMANKYQCPEAYFNMYFILTHPAPSSDLTVFSNDKNTENLALYYLLKAKELGFARSQFSIGEEFGEGKPIPNSSFYLKKLINPAVLITNKYKQSGAGQK